MSENGVVRGREMENRKSSHVKQMKPLCFILMPFGIKKDSNGNDIDFDAVYRELIVPAVEQADMEPIRADEEMVGGFIHKAMYERLMLCDFAIADLTTANANVFYELGIRHAVRPYHTLALFAEGSSLPFDVRPLRVLSYKLNSDGTLNEIDESRKNISRWLTSTKVHPSADSPLFQFFQELQPQYQFIPHEKTDIFRERVAYSQRIKAKLASMREKNDLDALLTFEKKLDISTTEGGIVIDLFLSYRALEAWDAMIALVEKMPEHLRNTLMVQEQLGFALNRAKRRTEAETVLKNAIETYGPSSETLGILGRVYKDRWRETTDPTQKEAWLKRAIDTYVEGFNADIRDAYPGVNALTLMSIAKESDERFDELFGVVLYAVKRRLAQSSPDYWDYATLMELYVLKRDREKAYEYLLKALPLASEGWMKKTTHDNLQLFRRAWEEIGEDIEWLASLMGTLL